MCAVMSAMAGIQTVNANISNGESWALHIPSPLKSQVLLSLRMCCIFGERLVLIAFSCCADAIAGISCAVLLALFSVQRYGTGRIGTAFSPVLILWFITNAAIGIYNIAR